MKAADTADYEDVLTADGGHTPSEYAVYPSAANIFFADGDHSPYLHICCHSYYPIKSKQCLDSSLQGINYGDSHQADFKEYPTYICIHKDPTKRKNSDD